MKKVALSLAGVMAATTFAPQEASALPLFARQTGMACNACHFMHFPMLNGFGRSFKSSAFTLMGAQGKVEGEDLSIPNTLNFAVLTTAGYSKSNMAGTTAGAAAAGIQNQGNGTIYVPATNGEFSMFVGGRVSDFAGALAEIGFLGNTGGVGNTVGVTSAKIPMLADMGNGMRAGVVLFTTDGQGASYGFETLNTGANAIHTMLFAGGDFNGSIGSTVSAAQYIGTGAPATGAAIVVNNSMGFINITKFHMAGPQDLGATGAKLGSTYARAAVTMDLAGMDAGFGIQNWSGSSTEVAPGSALPVKVATTAAAVASITPVVGPAIAKVDTKATAIDFQMQGEVAGMPMGVYASYAKAPKSTAAMANAFNGSLTADKSAITISTEWGVIPEKATVAFAIRQGKSGVAVAGTANATDNGILVSGSYKLAQNMMAQLVYTKQSGSFWTSGPAGTIATIGSQQTTLNLTTLF